MKPGKLDEQPMPLIVTTLWFGICNSTRAFSTAASTPKSPHPGHQSGSTLPFRSAIVTCHWGARTVAMSSSPRRESHHFIRTQACLHQDFVLRNRKRSLATQLFLHSVDDVVRHKWLSIVLSDMAVSYETGLAAKVARELSAEIVFDDDRVTSVFEDIDDRIAM